MNCVAQGGCWVRPADKAMCYYVDQYEEIPEALLYARYNSDPVDGLTVLWEVQSFGLSYEVSVLGDKPEDVRRSAGTSCEREGRRRPGDGRGGLRSPVCRCRSTT